MSKKYKQKNKLKHEDKINKDSKVAMQSITENGLDEEIIQGTKESSVDERNVAKENKQIEFDLNNGQGVSSEHIELNIDLKTVDMYEFQMRHSYRTVTGVISVAFSIGAFIYFLLTRQNNDAITNMLLILGSLLFTVIYPLQMLNRSFTLVKFSPVLNKTLNYKFTSEGILVSQDNDDALLPWENIVKVIETRRLILVYSSPKNGYILPKAQYKDVCVDIKNMIKRLVDKEICKLQLRDN